MKRFLCLFFCLVIFLSIVLNGSSQESSTSQSDKVYKIKLGITPGSVSAQESPDVMFAEALDQYIKEHTKGAIILEIYPGDQLGSGGEVVRSIISGIVEMGYYDSAFISNYYDQAMALNIPGLVESYEEMNELLQTDWANNLYDLIAKSVGAKVLGANCKGLRCFTTSNKELRTVDDAKGVTFRSVDSPVYVKMIESLGANAVPMPGSEMYVAMQNGVVDGQENPIPSIVQDKTYEVQKYLVVDEHIAGVNMAYVNTKFFDTLPVDLQKILIDGCKVALNESSKIVLKRTEEGLKFLEDYGMIIYHPTNEEKAAWHAKMFDPCMEYVRSQIGDKIIDDLIVQLEEIRKK